MNQPNEFNPEFDEIIQAILLLLDKKSKEYNDSVLNSVADKLSRGYVFTLINNA